MGAQSSSAGGLGAASLNTEHWDEQLLQEYVRLKQQQAQRAAQNGSAEAGVAGAGLAAGAMEGSAAAGVPGAQAGRGGPLQRMMVHAAMRELHEMIGELLVREAPGDDVTSAPDVTAGVGQAKRACDVGAAQAEKRPRHDEDARAYGIAPGQTGGADVPSVCAQANGGAMDPALAAAAAAQTQPGLLTAVATVSAPPQIPVRCGRGAPHAPHARTRSCPHPAPCALPTGRARARRRRWCSRRR